MNRAVFTNVPVRKRSNSVCVLEFGPHRLLNNWTHCTLVRHDPANKHVRPARIHVARYRRNEQPDRSILSRIVWGGNVMDSAKLKSTTARLHTLCTHVDETRDVTGCQSGQLSWQPRLARGEARVSSVTRTYTRGGRRTTEWRRDAERS